MSPVSSLTMILTGISASSDCIRPFSRKDFINVGSSILGTILAAMLPPMNTPPVAMNFRAQLPVSDPSTETAEEKIARLEKENAELRRKNASLEMDRAILKKAAAFFAKESE